MEHNGAPIDLEALARLRTGWEGIQDRLATDRIELRVDAPPDIGSFVGDESRVVQVLYNLLANAVGFAPHDSAITISVRRTEHNVTFSVTDSGPGIPTDKLNLN